MTKIKICGLSRPCDIEAVNRYRPDYCGFIFAEKSPRCVTAEQAAELKRLLAPEITAVGVFVDAPPEAAAELAEAGVIELIQLHGHETEAGADAGSGDPGIFRQKAGGSGAGRRQQSGLYPAGQRHRRKRTDV